MTQEAIAAFERAIARAPKNATYRYHLGLAYAKAGDAERAKRSLTQALELGTNFPGAADARARLASMQP